MDQNQSAKPWERTAFGIASFGRRRPRGCRSLHLINNGALGERSVLFRDEPEASLNPSLIRHFAALFRELAAAGVPMFVVTHDCLLTGELSLAAEYATEPSAPIRFFALSREGDEPIRVASGDALADLEKNPILDEFSEHYQREREAAAHYLKSGAAR